MLSRTVILVELLRRVSTGTLSCNVCRCVLARLHRSRERSIIGLALFEPSGAVWVCVFSGSTCVL